MSRRVPWPAAVAGGIVVAALVIVLGAVLLRPTSTAVIDGVAIECDGVGSTDACAAWATSRLAEGPGIHTFDPADLERMRLVRPFPLPGACTAEYYVGRDPDEPAARETIACPTG
jgi:hypothetical protein